MGINILFAKIACFCDTLFYLLSYGNFARSSHHVAINLRLQSVSISHPQKVLLCRMQTSIMRSFKQPVESIAEA